MNRKVRNWILMVALLSMMGIGTSGGCGQKDSDGGGGGCDENAVYGWGLIVEAPATEQGVVNHLVPIEFTVTDDEREQAIEDVVGRFSSSSTSILAEPDYTDEASVVCLNSDDEVLPSEHVTGSKDVTFETPLGESDELNLSCVALFRCVAVGTATADITYSSNSSSRWSENKGNNHDATEVTCTASSADGGPDGSVPDEGCDDDVDGETAAALAAALKLGITKEEFCNSALLRIVIDEILHSSNSVGSKATNDDHTETQAIAPTKASVTGSKAAQLFNTDVNSKDMTDFPCGDGPSGYTVCPPSAGDFPSGDAIVVFNVLVDDLPLNDSPNLYEYGFVFDQDDNAGNNYAASTSYPNDFFDGTDTWYVAKYSSSGWTLAATDATGGGMVTMTTDARIILTGNAVILVVPDSEFTADYPSLRVTNFRHTGDWGMTSGDWDGCVHPTVADGLYDWP